MVNANYCSREEDSQRWLQAGGRLRFLSANYCSCERNSQRRLQAGGRL